MTSDHRCPRCNSPTPRLHPAVQFEGEVSPCFHPFHKPYYVRQIVRAAVALVRHEEAEAEGIDDLWRSNSLDIPVEFMELVNAVDAYEGKPQRPHERKNS